MLSDKQYFITVATIDYLYFCLRQIQKDLDEPAKRSPIAIMIDESVGYDSEFEKVKRNMKAGIQIISKIIGLKRKIDLQEDVKEMKKNLMEMVKVYAKMLNNETNTRID